MLDVEEGKREEHNACGPRKRKKLIIFLLFVPNHFNAIFSLLHEQWQKINIYFSYQKWYLNLQTTVIQFSGKNIHSVYHALGLGIFTMLALSLNDWKTFEGICLYWWLMFVMMNMPRPKKTSTNKNKTAKFHFAHSFLDIWGKKKGHTLTIAPWLEENYLSAGNFSVTTEQWILRVYYHQ